MRDVDEEMGFHSVLDTWRLMNSRGACHLIPSQWTISGMRRSPRGMAEEKVVSLQQRLQGVLIPKNTSFSKVSLCPKSMILIILRPFGKRVDEFLFYRKKNAGDFGKNSLLVFEGCRHLNPRVK